MSKLDFFHTVIVSNYIKNKNDFINLMLTSKKNSTINKWYNKVCPPFIDSKLFKCGFQQKFAKFNYICFYEDNSYTIDEIKFENRKINGLYINILNDTFNNPNKFQWSILNMFGRLSYNHRFINFTRQQFNIIKRDLCYLFVPRIEDNHNIAHEIVFEISGTTMPQLEFISFNIISKNINQCRSYIRADLQQHLNTKEIINTPNSHILFKRYQNLKSIVIEISPSHAVMNSFPYAITSRFSHNPKLESIIFKQGYMCQFTNSFCYNPELKYVDFGYNTELDKTNFINCHPDLTIKIRYGFIRYLYIRPNIKYIFQNSDGYTKIGEKISKNSKKYYYLSLGGCSEIHMLTLENIDYLNQTTPNSKQIKFPKTNIIDNVRLKYMKDLEEVYIPHEVLIINNSKMFKNCHKLKRVIIIDEYNERNSIFQSPLRENKELGSKKHYVETSFDLTGCYELEEFPFKYYNEQDCNKLNSHK